MQSHLLSLLYSVCCLLIIYLSAPIAHKVLMTSIHQETDNCTFGQVFDSSVSLMKPPQLGNATDLLWPLTSRLSLFLLCWLWRGKVTSLRAQLKNNNLFVPCLSSLFQ